MNTLVIVESPGKIRKLSEILGPGYRVVASIGHVRDLPMKDLGIRLPEYAPQYEATERGADVLARISKAVASSDEVLLATDPDREGEAIAWHLADALQLEGAKRITFNALTQQAVKSAVVAPRRLDMALVHAQEARRVLDRLVGWRVSPAISDRLQASLTAGRVQTPALRLVVERENEIAAFRSIEHYGATLKFAGGWTAAWDVTPHLAAGTDHMLDSDLAQRVSAVRNVAVKECKGVVEKAAPPEPFITITLQQAASAHLKFSPQKTMQIAQHLYEQGAITYLRTDNPNFSDEGFSDIVSHARHARLRLASKRRTWKAHKDAQEAHEAIRPTHCETLIAGETDDERALYRLIWERAVASVLAEATYDVRTATLVADLDGKELIFLARGRKLAQPGWKAVYEHEDDEAAQDAAAEADNPVPALDAGAQLTVEEGEVVVKATVPPKRYTQALLAKALESRGIGRPATYAAILGHILERDYVAEDEKGLLSPHRSAFATVDALAGAFRFADYDYTAKLEEELDAVARGQMQYLDVVREADDQLQAELHRLAEAAPVPAHPCPTCGKPLRRHTGKEPGTFWWGCTGYPDCRTTLPDEDGRPGERKRPQPTEFSCLDCGKPLVHWQGRGRKGPYDFFGCSGFPACRATYETGADGKPVLRRKKQGAGHEASADASQAARPAGTRKRESRKPRPASSRRPPDQPGAKQ